MQKNSSKNISQVGFEALERLNGLGILPYPKHYNDAFMDILENSEDVDMQNIQSKYGNLFFKKTQCEDITNESIEVAKQSIKEFETSNKNIRQISDEKGVELSEIDEDRYPLTLKVVEDLFDNLISSIQTQLDKSDKIVKQLQEKIENFEKNANINPLTKIYNHNIFKNNFQQIISIGKTRELDAYIAIIDADNFKLINQRYGHVAGDKTLVYLARTLQDTLREGTKVYHTNGTEFVIVLNRMSLKSVQSTINRVVNEISQSKLFYKGNNIHLTISAGLTKHKKNDTFESIVQRAREALKLAKCSGKNCFKEVH